MVSSHRRRGWALGESCRFSKTYFFCIFEVSGIRFTQQFKGLKQYSCHMDDFMLIQEIFSFLALAGGFLNKVGPENLGMGFLHQMATINQHLSNFFDLPPSLLIPLYWYYTSGIRMGGYFKKSRIKAYDVDILMPSAIRITCVTFHG